AMGGTPPWTCIGPDEPSIPHGHPDAGRFAAARTGQRDPVAPAGPGRPGTGGPGQRGMLRRFAAAMSSILPTPPPSTIFVDAVAKPRICWAEIFGGIDRASGSVTTSINIGPGVARASASCFFSFLGSVIRTDLMPTPWAIAA